MTKKLSFLIFLSLGLLISGCNFPLFSKPADDPNALATAVALTVVAMEEQTLPTQQPPVVQPTVPASLPTVTPPLPTAAIPVAAPPTATPQPCNKAMFLSETIQDDTEFNAGETFNKSWTFKNVGTCTWNTNYKLVFASGEAMDRQASVKFSKTVAPDDQITIQVALVAPVEADTYTGTWKLQAEDGSQFATVTVRIKVKTQAFAVTRVKTDLSDVIAATCPYTYSTEINITSSAAGKVIYEIETSTGVFSGKKSLNFDAPGTKTVEMDIDDLGVDGVTTEYWLKVFIAQPNNQTFGPYMFDVTCP